MRRVQCEHCETVYKVKLIDPDTLKEDGHVNMCRCSIGGEEEIGYECGKGVCPSYRPVKKKGAKK